MSQSNKQIGNTSLFLKIFTVLAVFGSGLNAFASEAELHIPPLNTVYQLFGH